MRAAAPDDADPLAASEAVLRTAFSVLAERGLGGADATDATRALRASLHGFVSPKPPAASG